MHTARLPHRRHTARTADVPLPEPAAAMEPLEPRLLLSLIGVMPVQFPLLTFDSGGTTAYDAGTGRLAVDATPVAFRAGAASPPSLVVNPQEVSISIQVDAAGGLVGGAAGDDLIVAAGPGGGVDTDGDGTVDATGTLLTGEVLEFGFLDTGSTTDQFDFVFAVTGGSLAPLYAGMDLGVFLVVEGSNFTGDFSADFGGGAKGNIGGTDLRPRAAIGNYVWEDLDRNGTQDDGPTGIPGVTVELYRDLDGDGLSEPGGDDNGPLATTVTAGDGSYGFKNLLPGDYFVRFVRPAGYLFTGADAAGEAADSDADTATGTAVVTTLDAGETDLTWDAGLYRPVRVGDYVWEDLNGDGIQNDGAAGVAGVGVELYDAATGLSTGRTTATDATGFYIFDGLAPGDYFVEFDLATLPAGYTVTAQDAGGDDALDSDADAATGRTAASGFIASGGEDLTLDMGIVRQVVAEIDIEKYVRQVQAPGGEGLTPGFWKQCQHFDAWTGYAPGESYQAVFGVSLPGGDRTLLEALWTGGGGWKALLRHSTAALLNAAHPNIDYAFTEAEVIAMVQQAFADGTFEQVKNILAAENELEADLSDAPAPPPAPGGGFGDDADTPPGPSFPDGATVEFTYVVTNPGQTALSPVVVTDDNETPADASDDFQPEPVLAGGVNVGDTDADGRLDVGEQWLYTWSEAATPGQHTNVATAVGTPVDESGGVIGEDVSDADAANYNVALPPAAIGDRVWLDANANGIQDAGESGVADVTVRLKDAAGNVLATTTTDAEGNYLFENLAPGDYAVAFEAPAGFEFTVQDAGGDDTADSDVDALGIAPATSVSAGETDLTWDAGLLPVPPALASLGDYVWHDTYRRDAAGDLVRQVNGVQDADEEGLAGVVVQLRDEAGNVLATTTTDATGFYEFTDLAAGTYIVGIAAENFAPGGVLAASDSSAWYATLQDAGADDAADSDGDRTTHLSAPVSLAAGENNDTVDFGFFKTCVELVKSGPAEVTAGDVISYNFTVTNCGDVVLHGGAAVYDAMLNPDGNHKIWWDVVWPGEVKTFTRTWQTDAGDVGELVNEATVVGHPVGPDAAALPLVRDTDSHTVTVVPAQAGGEGCTPGFWKQWQHLEAWVGYERGDRFEDVFGVDAARNWTLWRALRLRGGGERAFARHAVAALLNAASDEIDYAYTTDQVIEMVQAAYATGRFEAYKDLFEAENEKGCDGDGSGGSDGCRDSGTGDDGDGGWKSKKRGGGRRRGGCDD